MKAKGPMVYNDVPGRLLQVSLTGSVGYGGENDRDDVRCIQSLLNLYNAPSPIMPALSVDGLIGPKTVAAIKTFQQRHLGFSDQRIDPGKRTIRALVRGVLSKQATLPDIPRVSKPDQNFITMYGLLPQLKSTTPTLPVLDRSRLAVGDAPNDWFDTPLTGWDVVTSGATDVGIGKFGAIRGTIVICRETDRSQRYRITYYAVGAGLSMTDVGFDFSDESMTSVGSRIFKGLLGPYPYPVEKFAPSVTIVAAGVNVGPGWGVAHVCFNGFVICMARCWLTGFQVGIPGASLNMYSGYSSVARA